jgi:endonuclease-3
MGRSEPRQAGPSPAALREVHRRLRQRYGPRPWSVEREPVLDALLGTILSQSTSDVNSGRAFVQLKAAFPDWDAVRTAPLTRVEAAIRSGGLAHMKAGRIREILRRLHAEQGSVSLEHLRRAPTARVKEELGRLPGVGPKTSACVLLFNLGRADFPVDTHIHRLARRLGWVPRRASAPRTYEVLNAQVPERIAYELHVLLITHGRRLCRARKPHCPECPLLDLCPHAKRGAWIVERGS